VILYAGCEQDGTNGTTDGDGVYQEESTVEEDAVQDGAAEDEYNLQRGVDQDTTDTTQPDGMQGDTTVPQDTTNGMNGTEPNATTF
jgi:hypothetical protein